MAEYSDLEDAVDEVAGGDKPISSYKVRNREVKYLTGRELFETIKTKAMLRGLQSSKRGLSVGQIDNAG